MARDDAAAGDVPRSGPRISSVGIAAAALALAVLLWGGYGRHWSWTGINGHTATLWDWLHLLLLPAAFAIMPVWLSRRTRLGRRHKSLAIGALAAFAAFVVVGYVVPWTWTGFTGNRLWDWLELVLLPVVVATAPIFPELREAWGRRHSLLALTGLTLFAVGVLGGYLDGWGWTGFRGNTLWDWLHLLLLPLLLPTVVAPAVRSLATAGVVFVEDDDADERGADGNDRGRADPAATAGDDPERAVGPEDAA